MHMKRVFGHHLNARFSPTAVFSETETDSDTASLTKATTTARITTTATNVISTPGLTTTTHTSSTSSSVAKASTTSTTTSSSSSVTSKSSSTSTSTSKTSSSSTSTSHSTTSSSLLTTSSVHTTSSATPTSSVVTRTISSSHVSSASALDSAATSSATASTSSGISTIGIVGIVGGAIVGAAVLVAVIMFFVRRFSKRRDDYDVDEFKDQSIVLQDEKDYASSYGGNGRGPRPPTMFERHNQTVAAFSPRPDFASQHNSVEGQNYGYQNPFSDYNAQTQTSVSPGMYMPSTAAPFLSGSAQSQAYPYPDGTPLNMHNLARSPSDGAPSMLSRGNSLSQHLEGDYADLNRSSVTPFQAAQYEAISKQLNIPVPVPKPLPPVIEGQELENPIEPVGAEHDSSLTLPMHNSAMNDAPTPNPFDDDESRPARPSSEFHHDEPQVLEIPESLRPRATSKPPSLPEIEQSQHLFSPLQDSFPVTVSPRKPSFDVPATSVSSKDVSSRSSEVSSLQLAQVSNNGHEGNAHPEPSSEPIRNASPAAEKPKASARPETLYDDEDAYGGI